MNKTLKILVENHTDGALLYYDFSTGFQNTAPLTSGKFTASSDLGLSYSAMHVNSVSGVNIAIDRIKIPRLNYELVNPRNEGTQLTLLFSFEKTDSKAGILFGSLVEESYSLDGIPQFAGRGFNIGVNSRNKLFLQSIDDNGNQYLADANEIELANKNICSVAVGPHLFIATLYDLDNDRFKEQTIILPNIIEGNKSGDFYYLGGSTSFYRGTHSFSGYLDKFLLISGIYNSAEIKSVASGFIATGETNSLQIININVLTGHKMHSLYETGYLTGLLGITGTRDIKIPDVSLTEFVYVTDTAFSSDGEKFITGYLTSDGEAYLEETAYLVPNHSYINTGNLAHDSLGLLDSGANITACTIVSQKEISPIGSINLYGFVTGQFPIIKKTGVYMEPLYQVVSTTGIVPFGNLNILPKYSGLYSYDYLYYLAERI